MAVKDIFNDMHDIYERWASVATDVYAKMTAVVQVSADGTPVSASNPLNVTVEDTVIPATADGTAISSANPLSTIIETGNNHIGTVSTHRFAPVIQTPTVTAGAYSINDAVGGKLTFANVARSAGGGGDIEEVIIIDASGNDGNLELWLFNTDFTAMDDNAAWAPSAADLQKVVAVISTLDDGQWMAAGTPSVIDITKIRGFTAVGTMLYGQLVTRTAITLGSTSAITVILKGWQD